MSEKEDTYHDTILDLEANLKKNVDLILKLGNSLQGMFMLGPKPLKRISKKRTKNQAKNDKTEHGMEELDKDKVKVKVKVNPTKSKVNAEAVTEETLNGPTHDRRNLRMRHVSFGILKCNLDKSRVMPKFEYQKLFDSIKKTRSQTKKEMDELIVHVSKKTYAYDAIRAKNQDYLSTISELKTKLEKVKKGDAHK
ncbi:hypothetical protein Tco_1539218 [Tanacetum coccineum]